MSGKNNFIFYTDYMKHLELLNMEQRGILITALSCYQLKQDLPEMDGITSMAFSFITQDMDANNDRYDEVCKRNKENGSKGGRPKNNTLVTETGKVVPTSSIDGYHFLYLIKDITTGEYKIGETSNLFQRRYDIKRPTNNLSIVDFIMSSTVECQRAEKEILRTYKDKSVGGDWFVADDVMVSEILSMWFQKKPSGYLEIPTNPKKPDNDKDNDKDNDNGIRPFSGDEDIQRAFESFKTMREQMNKPLANETIKMLYENLEVLSGGDKNKAVKIINQSVREGWKGFYALKEDKPKEKPKKNSFNNFEGRHYTDQQLLELERAFARG